MSNVREESPNKVEQKLVWETPVLRRAGHLGEVLQAKGLVSEDDPGDIKYKTPGHDC